MSQKARILRGSVSLVSADIASKAISALVAVVIARYLGQERYGVLSGVMAFVGLFAIFSDFGMNQVLVRQRAREGADSENLLANSLFVVGCQCLLTYLCIVIISRVTLDVELKRKLVVILGGAAVVGGFGGQSLYAGLTGVGAAILQGQQRMHMVALLQLVNRLVFLVAAILVVACDLGLHGVAMIYVAVALLTLIVSLLLVRTDSFQWRVNWSILRYLRTEAWAFGLSALFAAVYGKGDTLILSFLRTDAEVGAYNAAYTLVGELFFLPSILARSILPYMYQLHNVNPRGLRNVAESLLRWMVALAIPAAAGISILSTEINDLIYGTAYDTAVPLSILAWFLIFRFSTAAPGYLLTAIDRQGRRSWVQGFAALVNIVTNLILIPRYGSIGASIAMLISEAVLFGGSYLLASLYASRLRIERFIGVPLLASVVMSGFLFALRGTVTALVLIPLAGGLYVALLLLFRFISLSEIVGILSPRDMLGSRQS